MESRKLQNGKSNIRGIQREALRQRSRALLRLTDRQLLELLTRKLSLSLLHNDIGKNLVNNDMKDYSTATQ